MSKGHEQPHNIAHADTLSFAHAALMLAGIAGRQLGWRTDDFWQATPAELAMMLGHYHNAESGDFGHDYIDRLMKEFPDG